MGEQSRHPPPRRRRGALELQAGDEVEIHIEGAREFALSRKPSREHLLKRLRAMRGGLPADFVFDRDEAHGR